MLENVCSVVQLSRSSGLLIKFGIKERLEAHSSGLASTSTHSTACLSSLALSGTRTCLSVCLSVLGSVRCPVFVFQYHRIALYSGYPFYH